MHDTKLHLCLRIDCFNRFWETSYQEVSRLFRNTADEFLKIRVEGEAETIQVTLGHPFYVHRTRANLSPDAETDGDWILSKSLKVGDLLKDRAGEWKPILSIEKILQRHATYNFEVKQNHDYFVGENGWLVHNSSSGIFSSADPLVADVANAIESRYPGHVLGVNVNVGGHEVDILTKNAIVEVKQGGKGLARQVAARQSTGLPVFGYSPKLGGHGINSINKAGGIGTNKLDLLLDVIRP